MKKTFENDSCTIYSLTGNDIDNNITNFTYNKSEGFLNWQAHVKEKACEFIKLLPQSDTSKVILTVYKK